WANSAVQIGPADPNTETSPLGTYCSDQKITAQLDPVLTMPASAAAATVRRSRGKRRPRASGTAVMTTETATARSNANTNGGTDDTPTLIAAHVEPQRRTSRM